MPFIMWQGRRRWIDDDDEDEESSESTMSTSSLSSDSESPLPAQPRDSQGRWIVQITRAPMKTVKPAPLKNLMGQPDRKRKITLEE